MGQLGIGAMLHYLGGWSENDPGKYAGRQIVAASMQDDRLSLTFADGVKIAIWDNGQSCCEHRYMRSDDDVQSLVGHKLARIEAKPGNDVEGEYGDVHEVVFVEVGTDAGFITLANHNEHNGYYGGFGLTITEEAA
jgi:hypothetical protein